jgi:hypothetical protein
VYFALNEFKRPKTFSRWLKNVRAVTNENLIKPEIKPVEKKISQQKDMNTLIKPG